MANVFTNFFRRILIPSLFKDVQSETRAHFQRLDKSIANQYQQLENSFKSQAQQLETSVNQAEESHREMAAGLKQITAMLDRIETFIQKLAAKNDPLNAFGNLDMPAAQYRVDNPELDLMAHLYPFLPNRNVIDIGANVGEVSEFFLDTGFSVFAFEPFPPVFDKLQKRLGHCADFHPAQMAIGSKDATMDLSIALDPFEGKYGDPTVYNTLRPREISGDLVFTDKVSVTVRSLESLHNAGEIPVDVGMVKIDTEGYELEVIQGMGDHQYPVVSAEFWAKDFTFGKANSLNHLEDMVPEMRKRGYHWNLIICRVEGVHEITYFMNTMRTPAKAWGNVFFFREAALFQHAMEWHEKNSASYVIWSA